jgi:hypothetical protein
LAFLKLVLLARVLTNSLLILVGHLLVRLILSLNSSLTLRLTGSSCGGFLLALHLSLHRHNLR